MKVSCWLATWFCILGISKNLWWIVSFVIIPFFTYVIVTPRIILMLQCSKTSSLFRIETCRDQLSHPHSIRFMGMARKIKYFLRRSTYVSFQQWLNSPINEEPWASLLSTSHLSHKLYDTKLPRYLECFMDVTKPSETVMLFVAFASLYDLSSRYLSCFSFYFFSGMVTWEKLMSITGE